MPSSQTTVSRQNASATLPDPAERLLVAAGPVFAHRGFDRAPVREIAKRAGVNVAAVSYYFGDKMGLYRAVIAKIRHQREREFPAPILGEAPAEETLFRLVRTLLSRMLAGDEKGWEAQLMMREMQHPTAALEEMVREYFQPLYDALCQTIGDLLPAIEVKDKDKVSANAWRTEAMVPQMALGVVGQCLYYRIGRPVMEQLIAPEIRARHYTVESLGRHITATTLAACGNRSLPEHRAAMESGERIETRQTIEIQERNSTKDCP
ncbi:CerR family C-terminal domain-containing protein [Neorhodopirellula pilleata]|uniref:CerR family C-terminal domain-containing protein n=1 Tax=Neorhodopirellula pilleata TaxID=2714738 RepID=UPI0011B67D4E|nr:CerR family C-terminal domain-containing protein [Neorhodopirellula pilleata]